jgi:hypothetical protein
MDKFDIVLLSASLIIGAVFAWLIIQNVGV